MDTLERLWARSRVDGECWRWTGYHLPGGYGRIRYQGRNTLVHRAAFDLLVSPLVGDEEVDHLCRVKDCWRPEHLEAVTRIENVRRAVPYRTRRTHCRKGHPLEGENVRVRADGSRRCLVCAAERMRNFRQRHPNYHHRFHPPKEKVS